MKALGDNQLRQRNPKAGSGNPKSEGDFEQLGPSAPTWADDSFNDVLVLREDTSSGKPIPKDLQERAAQFGERIIGFAKKIQQNPVNNRLITQLVGAATSVGANYCEADDAVSGKEFKQKIGTCRKESKETMFFLRMIATAEPSLAMEARLLWREAKELNFIFGAIWRK
jgi:four helix bundle protein